MMKKLAIMLFALMLIIPVAEARSHRTSRGRYKSGRTQHVSGYTTKKGKHVRAYRRRPPN